MQRPPSDSQPRLRRPAATALLAAALIATALPAGAQPLPTAPANAAAASMPAAGAATSPFPAEIEAALARSRLPREAITLLVVDASGRAPPRLAHRTQAAMNPASIAKLATTFAALEQLGPAFQWSTPVFIDGQVQGTTLNGNLYLKGQGDPKLVQERLWLLLKRVQGLGIRQIAGDIVLDRAAFELPAARPAAFDNAPLRPYNAAPDALLVNFRSLVLTFTPMGDKAAVLVEPPLAGLQAPASVPLLAGDCDDWRAALKADFSDPARIRFASGYPAACGDRQWPLAPVDPDRFAHRAIAGLWQDMGGQLRGQVRDGRVPPGLKPVLEHPSLAMAELVRDINKFSNNVMAQQVFLTLSWHARGTGTLEGSREWLRQWWVTRLGGSNADLPVFDNGSGLSRDDRISAEQLARLLQYAWASPLMPEFLASLPVAGTDGTLRKSRSRAAGLAHLKTGSLRDVWGVAGYVHGQSGRRYVLVAIANHAQAGAMRGLADALVDWAARD